MYKFCLKCAAHRSQNEKFCGQCGDQLVTRERPKYIGVSPTLGVYRITSVVQRQFRSKDAAEDSARHSSFGEGEGDYDSNKVELVQLMSTIETHPYVCQNCPLNDRLVSDTTDGQCENCGQQNWVLRVK